jgi:hypothetical protein
MATVKIQPTAEIFGGGMKKGRATAQRPGIIRFRVYPPELFGPSVKLRLMKQTSNQTFLLAPSPLPNTCSTYTHTHTL